MGKHQLAEILNSLLRLLAPLLNQSLSKRARSFNPLRIIHGYQCLERRVRTLTPGAGSVARRSVEGFHVRRHRHALPIGVKAPPVKRVSMVLLIPSGIAGGVTH